MKNQMNLKENLENKQQNQKDRDLGSVLRNSSRGSDRWTTDQNSSYGTEVSVLQWDL